MGGMSPVSLTSIGNAADADEVLERFEAWTTGQGISLYPAQEEAILTLLSGANVIMATPTGSGKSLVAVAAHAKALAAGERSWYTAPIKALVSEKFFALIDIFGAANVGMLTGDAAVNPDAPIICATAEVLANQALRERDRAEIGLVVMDEFHFYAEPDRGWAWQVPLLLLPRTQFVLMSATLGDTTFFEEDLTRRTGRDTIPITSAERPVPLHYDWVLTPVHETIENLLHDQRAPIYIVHFTQQAAIERAQALMSINVSTSADKERIKTLVGGFRFGKGFGATLKRLVLHGIGVHHAGMLPKYRRLVETLAQAGLLKVVCGTDTLGVGINVPIRTVLLTSLTKYDGRRQRVLRAREFHQIAGRAGRAGFDVEGFVVVQAPEYVIDNHRALLKAGDDPKKRRKVVRKGPPEGQLSYTEATFDRLVAAPPEPLRSRMRVSHSMILNLLAQIEGQGEAMRIVLEDNHESDSSRSTLVVRAAQILASLTKADVIEPVPGQPGYAVSVAVPDPDQVEDEPAEQRAAEEAIHDRAEADGTDDDALEELTSAEPLDVVGTLATAYRVTDDLQDGFALNQPLSAFALAVLDILDEGESAYALDVVSVIEATLEDPRQVLMAQQFAARGEAVAQMKADGLEYEERLELLDDVTWPKPLADMLIDAFAIYRQSHPWVYEMGLSPKSVVREMYENAMTFGEYVGRYQLGRAEGILLRYLSDAYRALRQTVPLGYRDDELDDLIEWLGELIRQTDSSLVDEWESLINPDDDSPHEVRPEMSRALSANPRALRVMVRRAIFRRVELLALQRYAALAALDSTLTESQWRAAGEDYFEEYDHLGTGPEARGPGYLQIAEAPGEWTVTQILEDPAGDRDWRLTATLDLAATDEAGEPVFTAMDLAPWD
ncbi:DEAD/DEAH box helicase [Nostocoides veronense]|uniref:DEAD/DEAH box helicase n=2 Tax=Nostocoides veronense TaxID=330836 RepID=A0ABP4XQA2_9MICO